MSSWLQYFISIASTIALIFFNFIPSIHSDAELSSFLFTLAYFIMWIVMLENSKKKQYIGFLKFARIFWLIIAISFGMMVLGDLLYGFVLPLFTPIIYLTAEVFYGFSYLSHEYVKILPLNIIISMIFLHYSIMNLQPK